MFKRLNKGGTSVIGGKEKHKLKKIYINDIIK